MKRRTWIVIPGILAEVALGRFLDWIDVAMPWDAIILFIVAILLAVWIYKGKIVFTPWKWSRYKTIEVTEIEVPPELTEKVFGKPSMGKEIILTGKKKKVRIKKDKNRQDND